MGGVESNSGGGGGWRVVGGGVQGNFLVSHTAPFRQPQMLQRGCLPVNCYVVCFLHRVKAAVWF